MDLFHQKWTEYSYILPLVNKCSATNRIILEKETHQKYTGALRRQYLRNSPESQHLLDVLEGDFLRLLGGHGCDVHLQGRQPQGYVILQLRPKPLLNDIVTALRRDQQRAQRVNGHSAQPGGGQVTRLSLESHRYFKGRGLNGEIFPPLHGTESALAQRPRERLTFIMCERLKYFSFL